MAGTIVANTINTDTGVFTTNNAYQGIAKAWVNWNGQAGASIRSSFNVSSITYNSTAYYTINFATAMPSANYSIVGMCSSNTAGGAGWAIDMYDNGSYAQTASSAQVTTSSGNAAPNELSARALCVAVFSL
jgi:hypothetical protein